MEEIFSDITDFNYYVVYKSIISNEIIIYDNGKFIKSEL